MGLFSSSKSSSSVANYSTNVGFSDVSGPAIYGSGNVLTDQGAVESGERVAREGLRIVDNAVGEVSYLARDALLQQRGVLDSALLNSRDVFSDATDFARDALDLTGATQRDALDFAGELAARQASDLVQFASDQNTSADQRVEKIAGWALAAAVVFVGLAAFSNRRRAA